MKTKHKAYLKSLLLLTMVLGLISFVIILMFEFAQLKFIMSYNHLDVVANKVKLMYLLITTVPLLLTIFTSYAIIKSLKSNSVVPEFVKKRKKINLFIFSSYIILCITALAIVTIFIVAIFTDRPPRFFPTNDPQATYTIKHENINNESATPLYVVNYKTTSTRNDWYICDESNGKKNCYFEKHRDVETIVGNSPVELKPYLGKNVIVEGKFVYDNKQCIVNKCVDIGRRAVFDIRSIRLK